VVNIDFLPFPVSILGLLNPFQLAHAFFDLGTSAPRSLVSFLLFNIPIASVLLSLKSRLSLLNLALADTAPYSHRFQLRGLFYCLVGCIVIQFSIHRSFAFLAGSELLPVCLSVYVCHTPLTSISDIGQCNSIFVSTDKYEVLLNLSLCASHCTHRSPAVVGRAFKSLSSPFPSSQADLLLNNSRRHAVSCLEAYVSTLSTSPFAVVCQHLSMYMPRAYSPCSTHVIRPSLAITSVASSRLHQIFITILSAR
jgi:hypothetical protein